MSQPPLSRFAGQEPKPRPTPTLIVPIQLIADVVSALLLAREIFTVEPGPHSEVWHLGLFQSGVAVVENEMGPTGTVKL